MTNQDNIIPVLLWVLQNGRYSNVGVWQDDNTLSALVDGEIHRVDRLVIDDTFVQNTNKTAILLPDVLNENTDGYVDSTYTQQYLHDTLIEVDVVSKVSAGYCEQVALATKAVLLTIVDPYFDGQTYNFSMFPPISRKSFADENAMLWRKQLMFRCQGTYSTS
jgi:hypothetical protein